ncbi:MAG: fatty acid desaturase, partial [Pseudomonadota bacterium]
MLDKPTPQTTGDGKTTAPAARIFAAQIAQLKERDNTTNLYYIAQIYLIIVATAVGTIWAWESAFAGNLSWGWVTAISIIAIAIMGASQHNLGAVIHEGTHYLLFKNRKLNEYASDWLGGFPIYTSTHAYRLHHFAHHQFVNDPERDPIFDQIEDGQYWLDFPVHHIELLWGVLRLLWIPNLVKYIAARAKYAAIGSEKNPFSDPDRTGSPWPARFGVLFLVVSPAIITPLVAFGQFAAAGVAIAVMWLAITIYYIAIPEDAFPENRIKSDVSQRWTTIGRMTYGAALYAGLTWAEAATGA